MNWGARKCIEVNLIRDLTCWKTRQWNWPRYIALISTQFPRQLSLLLEQESVDEVSHWRYLEYRGGSTRAKAATHPQWPTGPRLSVIGESRWTYNASLWFMIELHEARLNSLIARCVRMPSGRSPTTTSIDVLIRSSHSQMFPTSFAYGHGWCSRSIRTKRFELRFDIVTGNQEKQEVTGNMIKQAGFDDVERRGTFLEHPSSPLTCARVVSKQTSYT